MRDTLPEILEHGRITTGTFATKRGHRFGKFEIRRPGKMQTIRILSSGEATTEVKNGEWEHVSVSLKGAKYTPTWEDMAFVKDLFWGEDETVVQFHPPEAEYVNMHRYTLHLWKPPYDVPTPPMETIGVEGHYSANIG